MGRAGMCTADAGSEVGGDLTEPQLRVQLPSEPPENTRNSVFPVEVQTSVLSASVMGMPRVGLLGSVC